MSIKRNVWFETLKNKKISGTERINVTAILLRFAWNSFPRTPYFNPHKLRPLIREFLPEYQDSSLPSHSVYLATSLVLSRKAKIDEAYKGVALKRAPLSFHASLIPAPGFVLLPVFPLLILVLLTFLSYYLLTYIFQLHNATIPITLSPLISLCLCQCLCQYVRLLPFAIYNLQLIGFDF